MWTETNLTFNWYKVKHDTFLQILKQDYFLFEFIAVSK